MQGVLALLLVLAILAHAAAPVADCSRLCFSLFPMHGVLQCIARLLASCLCCMPLPSLLAGACDCSFVQCVQWCFAVVS